MTIRRRARDGVAVFDIEGKIVGDESLALKHYLEEYIATNDAPAFLLLNVADVPFLDSAGLGAVVLAYQRVTERGGRIGILSPVAHLRRLLTVARLSQMIPVFDDEERATAALGPGADPKRA